MLSPYRVIELSSERTVLCGQVLADLGAQVTVIEPPAGSNARRIGPWLEDRPEPERSLFWWAYNRSKRSVTLDLDCPDGRQLLKRLVARADFLIEGKTPGWLAERGLGYADLARDNPDLIVVSITPFGQDGPLARSKASDLVCFAASTLLLEWGDPDRPPVKMSLPQAYLHAGLEAAIGALMALHERSASGLGQHVDASAQAALTFVTQSHTLAGLWNDAGSSRNGGGLKFGEISVRFTYPCRDGFVATGLFFGSAIGPASARLMRAVWERGYCDESIRDKDWVSYMGLLTSGQEPLSEFERAQDALGAFLRAHTKAELAAIGREHDLLIAPVSTAADLLASEQLAARDYWHEVEHPTFSRTLPYPGPFAAFSATPLTVGAAAPTLGRDNIAVYRDELGLTSAELSSLRAAGVI